MPDDYDVLWLMNKYMNAIKFGIQGKLAWLTIQQTFSSLLLLVIVKNQQLLQKY